MSLIISILVNALILVSLRKKTAERRGQQNACVWQTLQAYYLCVLWWSLLKLMFSGLWEKDLFKGGWSSAEKFLIQNCCHACRRRFAVFFSFPSCCVSSLLCCRTVTAWNRTRPVIPILPAMHQAIKWIKTRHFWVRKPLTFKTREAKCKTFLVKKSCICIRIKTHLRKNGFALSLALKLRLVATLACEQALRGALAAGREKEGELATTSLEFEFYLQFLCGYPSI